jgi:hypothetical protein
MGFTAQFFTELGSSSTALRGGLIAESHPRHVWRMWVLIHFLSVTEIFLTELTRVRQSFVWNCSTDGFDASKYQ